MAKPSKTTTPVAQIVTDLGGPALIAERLNTSPSTVRMWVHRRAIPRTVWPDLVGAFPVLTFDRLMDAEARAA